MLHQPPAITFQESRALIGWDTCGAVVSIQSKMEVDPPAAAEVQEPAVLPTFSVNILQTVQTSQSIHGLKHSDYLRYR